MCGKAERQMCLEAGRQVCREAGRQVGKAATPTAYGSATHGVKKSLKKQLTLVVLWVHMQYRLVP